jgi:diguanylate cyclase
MPPPALPTERRSLHELVAAADPSSNRAPGVAEQAARELLVIARTDHDDELMIEAGVWLCIHLLQQGKLREAISESHHVRDQLRDEPPGSRLGAARMELLRTIALAGSEAGEFQIAMGAAQELAVDPAVHADADAAFDAAFSLAVCLERMGDNWQALRILREVIERHGDCAPSFPMLYTLNGVVATAVGAFHRMRELDHEGEAVDLLITARDAAERAVQLLDEFENPLYRVAVVGNLGEVLIYQGELDTAERQLRTALAAAEHIGAAAHRDRVRASIGAWLIAVDRPEEALTWLERLVADLGEEGPHSTRIRAHHAAYLAARALGRLEDALAHHETYERLERRRTMNQLRSQSEMFVTKSEAQAEVDRHRYSAERDPLTGLGNRRHLSRTLQHLVPPDGPAQPFALAMVDVDRFKSINDQLGHSVGDAVLVEVAQVLLDATRDGDVVVRYGGEEILIVMPGASVDDATARCDQLRARIEAHVWRGLPPDRRLTVSIGVAGTPPCDAELVVSAADRAMYAAKRAGRNLVRVASTDDMRDATPLAILRP